jgi:hypothetical protein
MSNTKQIGNIKVHKSACGTYLFQSTKKFETVPKVIREYNEDGVRMYECVGKRHFIADVYDRIYLPAKSKPVKNKYYKGKNKNPTESLFEEDEN